MLSEVTNALFMTWLATEYMLDSHAESSDRWSRLFRSKALKIVTCAVLGVNLLDRVTGAAEALNEILQGFLHLPKVSLAALAYMVALFYDCKRLSPNLTAKTFLPLVGKNFLKVLPAYPFLAVMVSFVFMVVINIFEHLHIPLEYLNWPIYYGTLYGPFSFVYLKVKEKVVEESFFSLPKAKTPW